MAARSFEPMSIGGIVDRTFTIYRENFVRFLTIAAVVYVPIGLISALSTSMLARAFGGAASVEMMPFEAGMAMDYPEPDFNPSLAIAGALGLAGTVLLAILGATLASAALLRSVSDYYLGRDLSVGEAYWYVLPKLGTLILAGLLVGIVVMFGFMLLFVPGIIFSLWFALTTPAIVVENLGASAGMSRSKTLASGNLGKIFGTMFVLGLIGIIIAWAVTGLGGWISGALLGRTIGAFFLNQLFQIGGDVLTAPLWAVAIVLLYYDLRIRKEGFDLEMMAQHLGISEAQPYASASGPDL